MGVIHLCSVRTSSLRYERFCGAGSPDTQMMATCHRPIPMRSSARSTRVRVAPATLGAIHMLLAPKHYARDPNCSSITRFDAERARDGERCLCGNVSAAPAQAHPRRHRGRSPWGLPTAACPTTRYLTHVYPRVYRELRARGRILFHCSRAGGLGDYLRSIPEALAVALLLERAFVLRCDTTTKNEGIHVPWSHVLNSYFEGPHVDWRGLPPKER